MGDDRLWDPRYLRIHRLLDADPELAWPELVLFVEDHPETLAAQDLIEDIVHLHADRFIDRLERQATTSSAFAATLSQAHVGGAWGPGIDRFHALQDRLEQASSE